MVQFTLYFNNSLSMLDPRYSFVENITTMTIIAEVTNGVRKQSHLHSRLGIMVSQKLDDASRDLKDKNRVLLYP